jgi:putative transposase
MRTEKTYTARELAEIVGISKQAIQKSALKDDWPFVEKKTKGGIEKRYAFSGIPAQYQSAIINKEGIKADMLPVLAPAAAMKIVDAVFDDIPSFTDALTPATTPRNTWTPETAISEKDLRDPRIKNILQILREVDDMPRIWTKGKRKWIEAVAMKNDVQWQSIYRWMKKYEKSGIAGLRHTKSGADESRVWTPEALDWWIGLTLKKEHRKIDLKDLYNDCLVIEAHRRHWQIGCEASARWWYKKKATPLLLAYQKGGLRALDNLLPPVLRDYSDLAPFEMLVGDQHRFDFWVVDDETGDVFRPECYMWQDLRTRVIYGAAIDRKYDAQLIGLALRIGMRAFGSFKSIYTDNGRPEVSKYVMGIMADIRSMGMAWDVSLEQPMDILDVDVEEVNPCVILPGTHKRAIVKNAKAKMIEGTFDIFENILRSHFRIPGNVKRLSDGIHDQDVDQEEAKRLAQNGKLLLASEFYLYVYRAIDYYNRQKMHRGVLREWAWKPRPKEATPFDCLKNCYMVDGWRPVRVSDEAADLIFLSKASRIVHMGRIEFNGERFENDALLQHHGERVDLRYNPIEADTLFVFYRNRYLCTARPVEYSSMKDADLAERKIIEKRERRKAIADSFRAMTQAIPDFRNYSEVSVLEKTATLIGADKKRIADERMESAREYTQEELDTKVARIEALQGLPVRTGKPLPVRPSLFLNDLARYEWCIKYMKAGGALQTEDLKFKEEHHAKLTPDQQDYYRFCAEYGE